MIASTQWIKRNMMGTYSEKLGRPLTEAELRVQRCLERMPVPDWYQKYSRPPNFLKNCTPFECRPASWKTYRKPKGTTPRKQARKRSFRNSPEKSESESSRTSTADSGYNEACSRGSRRTPSKKSPCSSGTESDSPKIEEAVPVLNKSFRSPLNASNSFPRMSRSRKIENINIVFPKPFPAEAEKLELEKPKTVYTMTKNLEMQRDGDESPAERKKTHASFLIADVEPSGVTTRLQLFAGPLTSDSSSDEEQPKRCSPSPDTRFFNSQKKSTELEKIVQSRRTDTGTRSLIQEIIDELDRSGSSGNGKHESFAGGENFVKSMVNALERSCCYQSDEEDSQSNGSSDSELAKSTSISFKSYEPDSADDQPSSPLPADYSASEEEEDDIYWIPCKNRQLPRTSSQLSMMSKGSSGRRSGSPGLSPINWERREDWLPKQNVWRDKPQSRQLFRIDETGVADSGYSDRSSTIASSRTATSERSSTGRSASPTSSASFSPTLVPDYESTKLPRSGAYVIKSFVV